MDIKILKSQINANESNISPSVERAVMMVVNNVSTRDKIIFMSRLKYANDFSYKDLAGVMGITLQRAQQIFDNMLEDIKHELREGDE